MAPASRSNSRYGPKTSSSAPTLRRPMQLLGHDSSPPAMFSSWPRCRSVGADPEYELVTLLNTTAPPIDLTGWGLVDAAGGRQDLSRTMTAGAVVQVPAEGALQLGNRGEAVVLVDPGGGFHRPGDLHGRQSPTRTYGSTVRPRSVTRGPEVPRPPRSPKLCGLVQAGHPARFMIEGDHRQTAGGHQLLCRLALLLGRAVPTMRAR